ncbi:MAG: DEAD/DEAH box helicase [Victivallales bacterium]|nr:DEAD/DEAH box helicase [Victivallales bacterium]
MSDGLSRMLGGEVSACDRKKAEAYLKGDGLLFTHSCGDGGVVALFRGCKGECIRTELVPGLAGRRNCSCGISDDTPCIHQVALALHHAEANGSADMDIASRQPRYSGLKSGESVGRLFDGPGDNFPAKLTLHILEQPPHAPSKWETCMLALAISHNSKEYSGNSSNLRQLNFGRELGAGLRISQFSPQDRQIIRFLAVNAEYDGKGYQLKAEQAAEFFHCLAGFERCYCGGLPVCIHREAAEAVLLQRRVGGMVALKPALGTALGNIGIKGARMLVGRAGCWVGIDMDYWWLPGNIDVLWLRDFIRSGSDKYGLREAEGLMRRAASSGIRVVGASVGGRPRKRRCVPLYGGGYGEGGRFWLSLDYCYGDESLKPGGPGLFAMGGGGAVWRRDRKAERLLEEHLLKMGFKKARDLGREVFVLESREAAGMFLDEVLPRWLDNGKQLYLSGKLAGMISGKVGLKELAFGCLSVKEIEECFEIEYSLGVPGSSASMQWRQLAAAVKGNQRYIVVEGDVVGKITPALADFASATGDFVHPVKGGGFSLRISRGSAVRWAELYFNMKGSIPDDLAAFLDNIPGWCHPARGKGNADSGQAVFEEPASDSIITCEKGARPGAKYVFNGELRKYQREGVLWMRSMLQNRLNVVLADEMGLGKTIQALALLLDSMNREAGLNSMASMVVCPSSLVDNWQIEAARFAPELRTIVIRGHERKNVTDKLQDTDLLIISYAIASRERGQLEQCRFRFLLLDEAQHIKNPDTLNARTCKSLDALHKIVLTGTPLENSPEDLWSLFDFLHPRMLGSLSAFRSRFAGISEDEEKQRKLGASTAPFMMRRRKEEVEPDLPEKLVQNVFCEMDEQQRKLYEECRERGLQYFDSLVKKHKDTRFDLLSNLLRLRQICCHPALLPPGTAAENIPSAKTELLQELLLESMDSKHKVLIFSQFTSFLDIFRRWLDSERIPFEYLDGSTKDRMGRVKHFNSSPEIPFFLLSLKAGGVGLNLSSADRVIIYDPWWNPAVEAQATDRTHRIGQTRKVCSMKLVVKNSIEEKILSLQQRKQRIFCNLVENQSASLKNLTAEDLEFLLT